MAEVAAITVQAQVGMGGLAYLQHAMSEGLGRAVSIAEAERVWDDIHSPEGPEVVVDGEEHLDILARTYDRATAIVYDRSWSRVIYTRKRLVASDVPVSLVPGDGYDERGLAGAIAIAVPLDRQTLLWLEQPGDHGPKTDYDRLPSALLANVHNHSAVLSAEADATAPTGATVSVVLTRVWLCRSTSHISVAAKSLHLNRGVETQPNSSSCGGSCCAG
ncbi:hypothetical protein [Kribbella sp. ALI-6-A]|uniref:hypothetical protein n=1 Tax=Kribbella sp. ALI-6-A TaxID=1933817 RepID=UPI00117ACAC8|nr:hypothetical protein [Kribbella sp. ALI-6-A]